MLVLGCALISHKTPSLISWLYQEHSYIQALNFIIIYIMHLLVLSLSPYPSPSPPPPLSLSLLFSPGHLSQEETKFSMPRGQHKVWRAFVTYHQTIA